MDVFRIIEAGAAVATAVGVFIAARQLFLAKQQATTQFEDQLAAQYRDIIRQLPVAALLGDSLTETEYAAALPCFYHYIDLSNEQAFLHQRGRVSRETWSDWYEGIQQNLRRPAFERAWADIAARVPDSFDELRSIVPPVIPKPLRDPAELPATDPSQPIDRTCWQQTDS
jgi:hypothetical protein